MTQSSDRSFVRPPVRTSRYESPFGRWEMTPGQPHPALRPHVCEYVGWFEHMATPLCRRELPTDRVPVIINFGGPVRVFDVGDSDRFTDFDSFATGAYDAYVRVESSGPSGGVQINFTILGARLFFGRPLADLTNRCVPLEDLLGAEARVIAGRLRDAPDWTVRFDLIDRLIAARFDAARVPQSAVLCTWDRLIRTGGRVPIAAIVAEVGWSQKHLITRFREEIGLTPKTMARVLRFARAAQALRQGGVSLIDLAYDCGYYDQAHFSRDFREFAGVTPTELMASLLPDGGGISA